MPGYLKRQVITPVVLCFLGIGLVYIVLDLEKQVSLGVMLWLSSMLLLFAIAFVWFILRTDKQEREKALQVYDALSPYGFSIQQSTKTGNYSLTRATDETIITISEDVDVYELELLKEGILQGIAYCDEQEQEHSSIPESEE